MKRNRVLDLFTRGRSRYFVIIIAAIVVFATTYALILPAITVESKTAYEEAGIILPDGSAADTNAEQSVNNNSLGSDDDPQANNAQAVDSQQPGDDRTAGSADQEASQLPADTKQGGQNVSGQEKEETNNSEASDPDMPAMSFEAEILKSGEEVSADSLSCPKTDKSGSTDNNSTDNNTEADRESNSEPDNGDGSGNDTLLSSAGDVILRVSVTAEEGTFPAGTVMKVKDVAEDEEIIKAVDGSVQAPVSNMQAVDITFYDADGNEIEPAKQVKISFASDTVKTIKEDQRSDGNEQVILHIDDDGKTEVIDEIEESKLEKEAAEDEIIFEAEKFSVYVIVGTTIEKTVLTSDGMNYKVCVTYGEDAHLPADVDLSVVELDQNDEEYAHYLKESAARLGKEADAVSYARIFDISLVSKEDHEIHYQPEADVYVSIELDDADKDIMDSLKVLHINEKQTDVLETEAEGNALKFMTSNFSIYPIVEDTGENARIAYRFHYNDGTQDVLLSTQYFRYKDVHPDGDNDALEINEPSIPGIESTTWNRIFRGWSKNSFNDTDSNLITVADLNSELEARAESDYVEGTFIEVYANLKDVYYVTYVDVNPNNILATEIVPLAESGDTTFAVKPESQLRPTIDSDTVLQGWYEIDKPGTVYAPGQDNVAIDSNMTLYPKIEGGAWLVFDDNDPVWDEEKQAYVSGGASFTPPAFYLNEATEQPADPTWAGYEFGGWYVDKECTVPFEFGGTLDHDTTVFAKWIPSDSRYRVIIWKQRTSDDAGLSDDQKTYDYVTSYLIDEDVSTGDIVTLAGNYKNIYGPNGTSTDTDKAYFTYNADRTDQTVVVKADGSSVLNVYYDRKPVTLNYYIWDYSYTAATGNNGTQYGLVDGQYVQLTRSGNNNNYTWTYQKDVYTVSTSNANDYYYIPDGNGGYTYTYLYRRNGVWYEYYSGQQYTGEKYKLERQNVSYTGTRYVRSGNRSWQLYESFTGLYGSTLDENGYSWPNEYDWYSGYSTDWWGNMTGSGTRTTFMSSFLPTDVNTSGNEISVSFYGFSPSGQSHIHFMVQNLDGTYSEKDTVAANGGNFYISDKYIGYHAASYSTNNSTWTSVGAQDSSGYYNNGTPVNYTNNLYIRFDLTDRVLTFYTNNGSNQVIDYTVPYSKSLSEYDGQSQGQKNGYYFLGWYADPSCTEPFDFTQTMPDNNVAVYGKWRMERFRVVVDPGANNVYMGSQSTRFRLDFDETIDGGLMESATRAGYILGGWYTDPEFTNRFMLTNPVNSSTPGVDMTYQTSPSWAAARTAYGDDTPAYENVRGILHLYAKWIPDPSSTGINVVYDPGEAAIYDSMGDLLTTVPIDTHMYGFDGTATGREAPSNYNDLYTFKYWEATKEDGTVVTIHSGDPVGLAELAYSDPVYDEDTGEIMRKTVTLRAVYELTGDPSRITSITYDGDTFEETKYGTGQTQTLQGETRDGTHRRTVTLDKEINQTIVLPGEDDFYLNGYELTGWSFFEGSYEEQMTALEEYNAAHPDNTLTNFTPGQEVAADNLDQGPVNDRNNTIYAMWQPKTYKVTVRQVVENGVPQNSFNYSYKTGAENALDEASDKVQSLTGNSSFEEDDLGYYDRTGDVIHIVTPDIPDDASYSVRVNAIVTKDDGTIEILNPTADGDYQILGDVVITYTYSQKVLVKLRKRDATNHDQVLTNAVFTVTPVEFNSSTQHWENAGSGQTLTVNAGTLEKYLQEGSYRIEEVSAPDNYAKIDQNLYLTVSKDEPFVLFAENGSAIEGSVAELDDTGKILTVYDNPVHTVTLSKQVENDEDGSFSFKITVYKGDGGRLGNYVIGSAAGADLKTNNIGEMTVSLSDNESVILNIPHGSRITVEEAEAPRYEASYSWNAGTSVTGRTFGSDPVEITEDGTLAYTNNIKSVPVTLMKVGINNTDESPEESPLSGAVFTVYTTENGNTVAEDADGNQLKELTASDLTDNKGIFFSGRLKFGIYYLEETAVPDGYNAPLGRFKLEISNETSGTKITGDWITGEPDKSAGSVSGNALDGYTITVRNVAGVSLPSTGGPGTGAITFIGSILTAVAGAWIVMMKKKKHNL